jgi:hypothetical protein
VYVDQEPAADRGGGVRARRAAADRVAALALDTATPVWVVRGSLRTTGGGPVGASALAERRGPVAVDRQHRGEEATVTGSPGRVGLAGHRAQPPRWSRVRSHHSPATPRTRRTGALVTLLE